MYEKIMARAMYEKIMERAIYEKSFLAVAGLLVRFLTSGSGS